MHAHLILEPWEWISVKDHETENEYLLTIFINTIYRFGCKTYLDLRLKELWTVFRLQIQIQMKKRGISFRPVEGKLTNKYKCMFCFFMLWLMTMMMFLFLLLFYPRNFPLKFFQHRVSNRWNVAFVVLVVVVIFVVLVVLHVVVLVVNVDPTNHPLKFG